ncbi:MAG: Gfo/Idh/MocA family protein, partial [Gemmatimonadales bacterium]
MSRLRVGVIGAGSWGRNHVRAIAGNADAELAAVCDASAGIRDNISRQYPGTHLTARVEDLLGRVDAAIVATPARSHAELGLQAVEAGIPVLVEKPFALTAADAEKLVEAADRTGVPVLVGHLLEYHPVVERLRAMIESQELG